MIAQIAELVEKTDNFELVRDQIAAILLVESAEQMGLAAEAHKDPELWRLRVFTERSNPWDEFSSSPDRRAIEATAPIVNVCFDSCSFDRSASNVVERQRAVGVYHIDCYGYGLSADDGGSGHVPGDEGAALEAHRAVRLVRNILMAGAYTYLGMRGVVGRRFPESIQIFQPQIDGRTVQHVVAARITLQVEFNELSPQVQGQSLELVSLSVVRAETGELFLRADFPVE